MSDTRLAPNHCAPYWTVLQIAERWQCSAKKVRRLIAKRELIAHRFVGQLRIAEADLRAFERMHRED